MTKHAVPFFAFLLLFSFACSSLNQVTPKELDDQAIEAEIRKNLAEDIDTKAFDLSVKVNDGVVTLSGTVDTNSQRDKAGAAAREVNGVTSVINNIIVR